MLLASSLLTSQVVQNVPVPSLILSWSYFLGHPPEGCMAPFNVMPLSCPAPDPHCCPAPWRSYCRASRLWVSHRQVPPVPPEFDISPVPESELANANTASEPMVAWPTPALGSQLPVRLTLSPELQQALVNELQWSPVPMLQRSPVLVLQQFLFPVLQHSPVAAFY